MHSSIELTLIFWLDLHSSIELSLAFWLDLHNAIELTLAFWLDLHSSTELTLAFWLDLHSSIELTLTSENVSENTVWGACGAPQRDEASRRKVRHVEKILNNPSPAKYFPRLGQKSLNTTVF